MPNGNIENVEKLLIETSAVIKKYEQIKRITGENFNIFSILGVESKEVIICRLIKDLISIDGSHCQGNLYLKLFVKDVLGLNCTDDEWNDNKVKTSLEFTTDNGRRIDIIIESPKSFIAIETKIYAGDQQNQCQDYYKEINRHGQANKFLYYLTLDGRKPSKESLGTLPVENVHCISFSENIVSWIENCLKESVTVKISSIREILLQFLATVKKLTNQSEGAEYMEIFNLIKDNPEYCRAAATIFKNFDKFCKEMGLSIFNEIDKRISKERIKDKQDYENDISQNYASISYPYKVIDAEKIIAVTMEINDVDNRKGNAFGYTMIDGNEKRRTTFEDFGLSEDEIRIALKNAPCQISKIPLYPLWIYIDKENANFLKFEGKNPFCLELLEDKEKREKFIEDCANELNKLLQGSED